MLFYYVQLHFWEILVCTSGCLAVDFSHLMTLLQLNCSTAPLILLPWFYQFPCWVAVAEVNIFHLLFLGILGSKHQPQYLLLKQFYKTLVCVSLMVDLYSAGPHNEDQANWWDRPHSLVTCQPAPHLLGSRHCGSATGRVIQHDG